MDNNKSDRLNWIFAGLVTLVSLIVYLKTVAVSVSLWDCGEFVAVARIFGIAHPPGNPLFTIFGRVFSLIPFSVDIAHRINMLSAISSAVSIGFSYLIIARVVSWWIDKNGDFWQRLPMYLGGVVGALVMAFSRTWWTNAVEAEVYGLTMLISIAVVYIAVIWYEKREDPSSDKLIFLMIFLSVLGVAAHMAAYLVMPAILVFIFISSPRLLKEWRVWVSVICALLLAYEFKYFMYVTPIWLLITIVATLSGRGYFWRWALAFTFFMTLGFSIQYTTLVRAQHRARINMTDPNTFSRMSDFLERKQYGQGNMITRMLHRRGHLENQFGDYPRMGMLGFWKDQYSKSYPIFILVLFLGMWGLYYSLQMRWKIGLLLLLLILAGTIGITLYMNFADGSQVAVDPNAKLEVRDRDYFWTHGFAMYGWVVGLGIAAFLHLIQDYFRRNQGLRKYIAPVGLIFCLSIFLPVLGIAKNYNYNDRSGEWFPYQFAHDMLSICEPNAILFTAGDNDTYPLWALQETYGFRQDVKIINLSLANVDWYVLHALEVFGAPMMVNREQIEVKKFMTPNGEEVRPTKRYFDRFENGMIYFGTRPLRDRNTGRVVDVVEMAQLTIESVIEKSLEQRGDTMIMRTPVYFTSLTDPVQKTRFRDQIRHLEKVVGLYKIKDTIISGVTPPPSPAYPFTYNIDRSYDLLTNKFIFDGMKDPKLARGEFTTMMVYRYYAREYATVIDSLAARNDTVRLENILQKAIKVVPEYQEWPRWNAMRDSLSGDSTKTLFDYQNEYVEYMRTLLKYHPDNYYYMRFIADVLLDMGLAEGGDEKYVHEAREYLENGYRDGPDKDWMLEGLLSANAAIGDTEELQHLFSDYRRAVPQQYYRPMFILAADYIDREENQRLESLLRGYFRAIGNDPFTFKELMKYTIYNYKVEAAQLVQELYFQINPNDREAMDFLRQMLQPPPGQDSGS
jgi:hypothetical protein